MREFSCEFGIIVEDHRFKDRFASRYLLTLQELFLIILKHHHLCDYVFMLVINITCKWSYLFASIAYARFSNSNCIIETLFYPEVWHSMNWRSFLWVFILFSYFRISIQFVPYFFIFRILEAQLAGYMNFHLVGSVKIQFSIL